MNRSGELRGYALIADQMPRPEDKKYWTRMLNRDTAFFVGAEKIAHFLESPVLYVAMRRLRRGYYTVRFVTLAAPPFDGPAGVPIMEGFARELEASVRQAPADWLWLQKRWKYPRPADESSPGAAEADSEPAREAKARGARRRATEVGRHQGGAGCPGGAEADV